MGKLRSYAFWKFRSYSSTANFPRETSDLTLPGNLDLIPFWQNLNFSQEFSPGNLRFDAFKDNQPCSVLFQSCFSLKQSCFRAVQGCFPLIQKLPRLSEVIELQLWKPTACERGTKSFATKLIFSRTIEHFTRANLVRIREITHASSFAGCNENIFNHFEKPMTPFTLQQFFTKKTSRVEVPEQISAEQRCFRDFINFSADQRCFRMG